MNIFIKAYKWQDEYPDNCPSNGVQSVQMELFRFVETDPPAILDFIPHAKRNIKWYTVCDGWGISFYKTEDIIKAKQNNSPNFRNKLIAKGVIEINDGKVLINDKTGHINLWIYDHVNIHSKFRVI